jgi:hypothetical protein
MSHPLIMISSDDEPLQIDDRMQSWDLDSGSDDDSFGEAAAVTTQFGNKRAAAPPPQATKKAPKRKSL